MRAHARVFVFARAFVSAFVRAFVCLCMFHCAFNNQKQAWAIALDSVLTRKRLQSRDGSVARHSTGMMHLLMHKSTTKL